MTLFKNTPKRFTADWIVWSVIGLLTLVLVAGVAVWIGYSRIFLPLMR